MVKILFVDKIVPDGLLPDEVALSYRVPQIQSSENDITHVYLAFASEKFKTQRHTLKCSPNIDPNLIINDYLKHTIINKIKDISKNNLCVQLGDGIKSNIDHLRDMVLNYRIEIVLKSKQPFDLYPFILVSNDLMLDLVSEDEDMLHFHKDGDGVTYFNRVFRIIETNMLKKNEIIMGSCSKLYTFIPSGLYLITTRKNVCNRLDENHLGVSFVIPETENTPLYFKKFILMN